MINPIIAATTSIVVNDMTDDELLSVHMAVLQDFDPKQAMGYEKAASLFAEEMARRCTMKPAKHLPHW